MDQRDYYRKILSRMIKKFENLNSKPTNWSSHHRTVINLPSEQHYYLEFNIISLIFFSTSPKDLLVSFDIISIFTKFQLPIQLSFSDICYLEIKYYLTCQFSLKNISFTYFMFQSIFYQQIYTHSNRLQLVF